MLNAMRHGRPASRQRGFSLVELMVGTTVGLLIIAGTVSLYAAHVTNGRKLLLEARLHQDMRAAMDLVSRDLRRAGYWGNAIKGTVAIGAGSATAVNPYRVITSPSADEVTYQFSRDAVEDDAVGATEEFGFRLASGVLQMQTEEGSWQPMTDPTIVTVQDFSITPTATSLPLGSLCPTACPVGTPNCPSVTVMRYDITLPGRATSDANIVRTLVSSVRPRNDRLEGQCPA